MIIPLARREWMCLFRSPVAFVVLALFCVVTGLWFLKGLRVGGEASLRGVFDFCALWLMPFLMPAISMRLLSEEFRAGTFEKLKTCPISDTQVVLGKWFGALGFLAILLLPMFFHMVLLEGVADPEWGSMLCGWCGLFLVGALYLAVGTCASACTDNQVVAFVLTVAVLSVPSMGLSYMQDAPFLAARFQQVAAYLSVELQYGDFSKGVIDLRNFVYFGSGCALFLFWAVRLLESRRWRG